MARRAERTRCWLWAWLCAWAWLCMWSWAWLARLGKAVVLGVAARVGVGVVVGVACARLQGPVQRFASVLSGSSDRIFLVTEVSIHFLGNQPLPMSREQSWTLATSEMTENELGRRRCPPVIKGFVAGPPGCLSRFRT